jgi:hypothetical protein
VAGWGYSIIIYLTGMVGLMGDIAHQLFSHIFTPPGAVPLDHRRLSVWEIIVLNLQLIVHCTDETSVVDCI